MSRRLTANALTTRQRATTALLAALFVACGVAWAGEPGEPDEREAHVVQLERPEQSLDTTAPPSRLIVPKGDVLWDGALLRATKVLPDHGGGFFPASDLVAEGFRSAAGFTTEKFSDDDSGGEQLFVLSADQAAKDGTNVTMTNMRMVYFLRGSLPVQAPGADKGKPAAAPKAGKAPAAVRAPDAKKAKPVEHGAPNAKKANPGGPAAPAANPTEQYRVVLTAPEAVIDTTTNTFSAKGKVVVLVYQRNDGKGAPGKAGAPDEPIATLTGERLMWRTWDEPQTGAKELAVYTPPPEPGKPDLLVTAKYLMAQADGTVTTILMQGRGLVYEVGSYDRLTPKEDEEGRTAGLSKVSRNRALFHRHIRLETTAVGMAVLMPFQGADGPPVAMTPGAGDKPAAPAAPPTPPSRTVLFCAGPAVLNLAAVPRAAAAKPVPKKADAATGKDAAVAARPVDATQDEILLSRRFEFYNGVSVVKTPLELAPGAPPGPEGSRSEMKCGHLCMQYAADVMPGPTTFPEYSEAIDSVRMNGVSVDQPRPGAPPPVPQPYSISCQRIYYDGPSDNTFLVGTPTELVDVKQAQGDVSAQQFCYRRLAQTLTMPVSGPKRMVIKPAALAHTPPPDTKDGQPQKDRPGSPFSLSAGETIINWQGPMSREIRHLPVPHGADRIKEVLILHDSVLIEQPTGGLKMRGQVVRVVRNMPGGEVEFLESRGDVDVSLGQLQARGETVMVETESTPQGEVLKDITTVVGNRAKGKPATLFTETSAIRSEKFIIDRKADTFQSFGGAVAIIKPAEQPPQTQPKPPEAQDAGGLFKGISLFDADGSLRLQCDGEFSQDGATHTVRIRKNVVITQPADAPPGLEKRMRADEVDITIEDAPATAPGAPPTPANQFFSGGLKSLECRGNVELSTPDELVQCDRLFHDKPSDSSVMEVNDPGNDVRIYMHEETGTRILSSQKSLVLDGKSGRFTPGGVFLILPYHGDVPAPRDKDSSPARKKTRAAPPPAKTDGRK